MYRFFCAVMVTAIFAGIAWPTFAQLPMSPAYRDGPTKARPSEAPAVAAPPASALEAKTKPQASIVATAPIPPPAPRAAGPTKPDETAKSPPAAAEKKAAVASVVKRHAPPRRYASYPRYRTAYQTAGGWAVSGSWHLGPNPYAPNGHD